MIQIFRDPRYRFMKYRVYGYAFSALIIGGSLFSIYLHWARTGDLLNYGVDFRGGTAMQVRFGEAPDVNRLRQSVAAAGHEQASIQTYGQARDNTILIRVSEQLEETHDLVDRIRKALRPAAEQAQADKGLLDLNTAGEEDIGRLLELAATGENAASPDPKYVAAARAIVAARGQQPSGMFADLGRLGGVPGVSAEMVKALEEKAYLGTLAFLKTESVGPTVGRELRSKALVASIVANVLILMYLWFRFELRFGVAAVACLIHDVLFVLGVFALLDLEFDLTVLAAILTVIGFSVNDTIVVFDRIRSNLKVLKREPLEEILDRSVNQTLSRTILTNGLTLLTVLALLFYGGEVLKGFAVALTVGIIEGTYSSIFIAAPMLLVWRRLFGKA